MIHWRVIRAAWRCNRMMFCHVMFCSSHSAHSLTTTLVVRHIYELRSRSTCRDLFRASLACGSAVCVCVLKEGGVCQINPPSKTEAGEKEKSKTTPDRPVCSVFACGSGRIRHFTFRGDKSFNNPHESEVFAPVRAGSDIHKQ